MGAVYQRTPARYRVRALAGMCIALTALTGAVTRPLRPLKPFLVARAMRCPTALLSQAASASRATAVGGVLTRRAVGAARFNTAPPSLLFPRRAAPLWAAFLLPCSPHPRRSLRCVLGAFLRVLNPCPALCPLPDPVPRPIPRLIRLRRPVPSRGSCLRSPLVARRCSITPQAAKPDKRIYVLFSG